MNDPAHIVGRIPACASEDKRRASLAKLRTAVDALGEASAARQRGRRCAYRAAMRKVFGADYPWHTW